MIADMEHKKAALKSIRGMLRKGSAHSAMDDESMESPEHEAMESPEEERAEEDPASKHPDHGMPEMASHESAAPMSPPEIKGGGQFELPAPGPASGKKAQPSPTESSKPGSSGPGWRESDSGHGASELRARSDGADRSADGDGLVEGLIRVAKKFKAP